MTYDPLAAHPPLPPVPPTPGHVAPSGKQKNWMGVVALVSSFVCGLQIVGLIFGALGLRAVKRGAATNRGMALFAVLWCTTWLVIAALLVAWFVADPAGRTRDLVRPFGSAGADVAAIDEAIYEVRDAGGTVTNIGWDGRNYYVGDIVVPAESGNPEIYFYVRGDNYCLEIVNSSVSNGVSSSSRASLSRGTSCTGTPQLVLSP